MSFVAPVQYGQTMDPAWITWIREISDHAPNRHVAAKIGVAPSTLTRWKDYPPKVDEVVKLARAYGAPVADGLLAAGYVQPGELRAPRIERDLGRFTATELLAELGRRVTPDDHDVRQSISSPADYGEEPTPDDFDLAAGTVARDNDNDDDSH